MVIKKHMIPQPVFAHPEDSLHDTYLRMRERNIRHMPVLDKDNHLLGILSERDVLRPAYIAQEQAAAGSLSLTTSVKVSDAMTSDPVTLHTDDGIRKALDLFLRHKFGALPVVDADNKLVGIISTIDMLDVFRDQL